MPPVWRGLSFSGGDAACAFFERVAFYRFKGYLLHFERKIEGNTTHAVPAGTTFEKVLALYELDHRLRLLFFEAIGSIEIAFRSAISNAYSLRYGPHWWKDPMHFSDQAAHANFVARVRRELGIDPHIGNEPKREREVYIEHRLWNKVFVIKPTALTGYEGHFYNVSRVYPQAFAAAYLLRRIQPSTDWHIRLKAVLMSYPDEERGALGAPPVWFKNPFWSEAELPIPSPKTLPAR